MDTFLRINHNYFIPKILNHTNCLPTVSSVFLNQTPHNSFLTTPGTYRLFGHCKELLLDSYEKLQIKKKDLLMDNQCKTPYCNPYRLATLIGEQFNKHYKKGDIISQSDLKQIQSSILNGNYVFSSLRISNANIMDRKTPLPWYTRAYLVGNNHYKHLMVEPKDLLVMRALGEMLHFLLQHCIYEGTIDVSQMFEVNSLYADQIDIQYDYDPSYSFYNSICEMRGISKIREYPITRYEDLISVNDISDFDDKYLDAKYLDDKYSDYKYHMRASHLYYIDFNKSLSSFNKEKIISNLTPYVRDPKIIKLIKRFLNIRFISDTGKSISLLERKSYVIPPVGCLLTDSLFEFAILDFDNRLFASFLPPYSISRRKNEIFLVRPREIHISELVNEDCLTNEKNFDSILKDLLDEYDLSGTVSKLEPGIPPLRLPLVPSNHLISERSEFRMLMTPEGYIHGSTYHNNENDNDVRGI